MTTSKRVAEVLNRAADTIAKLGWVKGTMAVDCHGISVTTDNDKACRFCAMGAVRRVARFDFDLNQAAIQALGASLERRARFKERTLNAVYGAVIPWFNDVYAKDKRYVIRALRRAARELREAR